MGWKIVEIENGNYLKLFLDNLVIYHDENKITIPIKDIDVLLINNYRISLSVQLINAFSENNTLVILCNNKHMPQTYILPIIGNYNSLKIMENQLNWNHNFKSHLWTNIVKQKIKNQADFLMYLGNNVQKAEQIYSYINEIKPYDISNREGHASKVYWNTLYGNDFSRESENLQNMLLNYGYTVLNGYISRAIIKKGLDPRISLFHKAFHNHFALSSDLIEPFRILIDKKVYEIYLSQEDNLIKNKQSIINVFNQKISINNSLQFINNAIDIYIDSIINQTSFPIFNFFVDDK